MNPANNNGAEQHNHMRRHQRLFVRLVLAILACIILSTLGIFALEQTTELGYPSGRERQRTLLIGVCVSNRVSETRLSSMVDIGPNRELDWLPVWIEGPWGQQRRDARYARGKWALESLVKAGDTVGLDQTQWSRMTQIAMDAVRRDGDFRVILDLNANKVRILSVDGILLAEEPAQAPAIPTGPPK